MLVAHTVPRGCADTWGRLVPAPRRGAQPQGPGDASGEDVPGEVSVPRWRPSGAVQWDWGARLLGPAVPAGSGGSPVPGWVPAGSLGMEGQVGVLSLAVGGESRGLPCPGGCQDGAGARELGLARARGAVLCSGHVGFAPHPAGQGTGRVGVFGVKEGSRCTSLGLFNLDGCSPHGCLLGARGLWGGPRFPFPQPTLSQGQAGWCCAFGGQEQVLLGSGPDPAGTGAVLAPAPGLPVVGLCCRCCMGYWGFSASSWLLPALLGRSFWCPIPASPSLPIVGVWHQRDAAESPGEGLGRAAHAREAAGLQG